MNMNEAIIVETALENLEKFTGIPGTWKPENGLEFDGNLNLRIDNEDITFHAEVKNELRATQLNKLIEVAEKNKPFILIARRIFPLLKIELQKHRIAYLEANGNVYFDVDRRTFWIELNHPAPRLKDQPNRAFTRTGLKVVFHFLLEEDMINLTYREIAAKTETALGHINYVMQGLKEAGFLIPMTKDTYKLTRKKELLEKWIEAYHQKLKPTLKVDTFQFVNKDNYFNWKEIVLKKGETFWGGEPAGDILTNYLNPGEFTMYTTESRQDLIKNYKMVPAEKGNINVYRKFWFCETTGNMVPEILAYADLANNNDRRSQETAQKIYDEYLQNEF